MSLLSARLLDEHGRIQQQQQNAGGCGILRKGEAQRQASGDSTG
jgi:hypothetical protein